MAGIYINLETCQIIVHCSVKHLMAYYLGILPLPRPFSKMAAENLNKSKWKTNTSTRMSILNLVTLQSFSISGEISAEKM